jgi:putative hydrolase of the HAD superfamily
VTSSPAPVQPPVQPPVQHVLLDADGVLQHVPDGSLGAMRRFLGERADEFLPVSWELEEPALRGQEDFVEVLAKALADHGIVTDLEAMYAAVWLGIDTVPEALALVPELRAAGYAVHLGTNQHRQRAELMRGGLGYDELFDVSVYSCDVGHAKPEPAYFTRAAELIGADPGTILFVDDRADNVASARSVGMRAEQWEHDLAAPDRAVPRLRALLARHGIRLDS